MDTLQNESLIKLALDVIDLVILRWRVEAMSNKSVHWEEHYRLTRARDLLAECDTTVVRQNRSTRKFRHENVTDNRRHVRPYSSAAA